MEELIQKRDKYKKMGDWGAGLQIIGILLFILWIILLFAINDSQIKTYTLLAAVAFFVVGRILYTPWNNTVNEISKIYKSQRQNLQHFDADKGCLTIKDCVNAFQTIISVKDVNMFTTRNVPVKVHVGAATVGGVTTGGVYTTGGGSVIDKTFASGKAYLEYCTLQNHQIFKGTIRTIRMTPDVYNKTTNEAIKSLIKQDSQGYYLPVIENSKLESWQIRTVVDNTYSTQSQEIVYRDYPTRNRCELIYNWLIDKK